MGLGRAGGYSRWGWTLAASLTFAGCRPARVSLPERMAWRCVPLEIASIDSRAQEVQLFFPGDRAHSFKLVSPYICRDLTETGANLANVLVTVRGTAKAGVESWHPETINRKSYETLDGSSGKVPAALQIDFRRAMKTPR